MQRSMSSARKRRIVDAHLHLIDHTENHYEFLEHVDATFEALIGDYSALPRRYLLDDYLRDAGDLELAGLVWHEMLSSDPLREVQWAQKTAERLQVPMSIVGLADFLSPELEARLEAYSECTHVVAVREHLGWDETNPLRRFAKRPDLLADPQWQKGLATLKRFGFRCSLKSSRISYPIFTP